MKASPVGGALALVVLADGTGRNSMSPSADRDPERR
jgi:hypothetical protein